MKKIFLLTVFLFNFGLSNSVMAEDSADFMVPAIKVLITSSLQVSSLTAHDRALLSSAVQSGSSVSLSDVGCYPDEDVDVCHFYLTTPDDESTDIGEETTYLVHIYINYEGKVELVTTRGIAG